MWRHDHSGRVNLKPGLNTVTMFGYVLSWPIVYSDSLVTGKSVVVEDRRGSGAGMFLESMLDIRQQTSAAEIRRKCSMCQLKRS